MDIQTVGVVGAGTMGNGIAHVFAKSGYKVLLRDVEQSYLDRAMQTISKNLEREVAKQKLTAEQRAKLATLAQAHPARPGHDRPNAG
jgi:3-hydroxybutyryl-CoA dehydrogenase